MSITISFKPDLKTKPASGPGRVPLAEAKDPGKIYGSLSIQVNGKTLPHMGYVGEDDVDFGDWIRALSYVLLAFENGKNAYTYDPGSQERPAYKFVREGDVVQLSVVDSPTGGAADPNWQNAPFSLGELQQQYTQFKQSFLAELGKRQPALVEKWSMLFGWPEQKDNPNGSWAFFGDDSADKEAEW